MNKKHKGKKIMLIHMEGESSMPFDLLGTIQDEDDAGQIHVNWDNGSHLALIPGIDEYKILTEKETRKLKLDKINENK